MTEQFCRTLLFIFVVVVGTSCRGLAGEPRIVATLPAVTTALDYPASPPDIALGAEIYATRCVQCHGLEGSGDGTLIGNGANQIANAPRSFLEAVTTAEQTPLEWYQVITNGRIEKLMPPWKDALSDAERWAVALYTYTLHYGEDSVVRGQTLVSGIEVANLTLPDVSETVKLTDAELVKVAGLPITELNEVGQRDLAAYLRSTYVINSEFIGRRNSQPVATEEAQPTALSGTGSVRGQVVNGTAGGAVVDGLKAVLYAISQGGADIVSEAEVGAEARFQFDSVDLRTDRNYIVTVNYAGRIFGSELKPGDAQATILDLPVKIYDLTDDSSILEVAGWVARIQVDGNIARITQGIRIVNTSDRAYSTDASVSNDRYASIEIGVPTDADIQGIDATHPRYVMGDGGLAVVDTSPVLPGKDHIVQIVYDMLLVDELQIEQPLDYAFNGPVRLLVEADKVQVLSDTMVSLGPQQLEDGIYDSYGADFSLKPGEAIRFNLKAVNSSVTSSDLDSEQLVPIGLLGAGVIMVGVAGYVYWRTGRKRGAFSVQGDQQLLIDGLISQMAELDALEASGEVDELTYQKRRARLKMRLGELLDKEVQ